MRHITFITASRNDSNAIYKLMDHWREGLTSFTGEIKQLDDAKGVLDVVVADCPVHAYFYRKKGGMCRKLVVLNHSFENIDMMKYQFQQLDDVRPHLVIITSGKDVEQIVSVRGYRTAFVPISINTSKFTHLPYPAEFTIGYIGANMTHKRFEMVRKAGEEAGVKILGSVRKSHYGGEFDGKETDFYRQISCYVSATKCEHAPFPTLEALLCGRPLVIPPIVSNPPELRKLVEEGAGEVAGDMDRVCAIMKVRDSFDKYAAKARTYVMRSTTPDFEQAIRGIL